MPFGGYSDRDTRLRPAEEVWCWSALGIVVRDNAEAKSHTQNVQVEHVISCPVITPAKNT